MRARYNSERGSVLLTTLIITALVTVVVAALLMVVQQQHYFTARSTTWCSEIPIAEAGIEDAMAFLNSRQRGLPIVATNGWTNLGPNIVKLRYFTNGSATLADGYYFTAISTARPPTVVS